ncbi:MAG: diacylglycerol kinase family protein [Bacteroides sp.]|nr:diacylglycerol kinase family protein [Bacteroides sp.]
MNKSDWNINKRVKSFGYAFKGIAALFSQPNACIHACVTAIVIICGVWLGLSDWEWCVVALCIGGVLMAEAFNTAIEALADKISPDFDPLIGKAKDIAAGAVLIFVFAAVAAGLIIFLPKFLRLFY